MIIITICLGSRDRHVTPIRRASNNVSQYRVRYEILVAQPSGKRMRVDKRALFNLARVQANARESAVETAVFRYSSQRDAGYVAVSYPVASHRCSLTCHTRVSVNARRVLCVHTRVYTPPHALRRPVGRRHAEVRLSAR